MSCPNTTEISRYRLALVKSDERPKHIGLDLRVYPDAESKKKADDKFKELFPFHVPMFGGEAKAQEIAEHHALDGYNGYLYRITDLDGNPVRWVDGQEEVFANSRNALEKVVKYSTFTSPVKMTKKKVLAMFVKDGEEDFTGKTAGDRIMSDKQDDEFREFLKTV